MSSHPEKGENLRKGFLYAGGGMVLISMYFITGKYALRGFNPETFCFVWTLMTTFFSFVFVLLRGRLRKLRLPRRALPGVAGLGLSTGVGLILLYSGLARLDPSFMAFLARSHPVMVILLGVIFLKERLRRIELLPMALMLVGGVVSVLGRWQFVGLGVTLAFLGYVAFAFHRLFVKVESARVCTEVLVFYRVALAFLVIAVWMLASGRADFNVELKYWLVALLGSFLSPCVGNLLSFHAYQYYSLSRSALILMIQPLLVLPMAYLFLGKFPSGRELAGGLVILAGAAWISWIHLPRRGGRELQVLEP